MATEPAVRPKGRNVVRIVWVPGSDSLEGTCHCGATRVADDPIELWNWLLGHPTGHTTGSGTNETATPYIPPRVLVNS
ncbi:hypothetical protein J2X34_001869 [Rhodococcus sp. BE178]|jgi:hypothetical protein